jgi:hypothetical protein
LCLIFQNVVQVVFVTATVDGSNVANPIEVAPRSKVIHAMHAVQEKMCIAALVNMLKLSPEC